MDPAADSPAQSNVVTGEPESTRFAVRVEGFEGSLEDLVRRAQHGDIDLTGISVSEITQQFRRTMDGPPPHPELRDVADFLTLTARLIALKANAVLPDRATGEEIEAEAEGTEAGRRLAEYRLFKAAAEALLSEAAEEGARSFLGMVSPDVIPVERMRIPPERLAAAFRAVLERLADTEALPVGAVTFSVEEKVLALRSLLARGPLRFEDIFQGVSSRLEAVACFLALLELLKLGEASVDQREPFGPITVQPGG